MSVAISKKHIASLVRRDVPRVEFRTFRVPALVAKLADALGSGPSGLNAHGGSSPSEGTQKWFASRLVRGEIALWNRQPVRSKDLNGLFYFLSMGPMSNERKNRRLPVPVGHGLMHPTLAWSWEFVRKAS